MGRDNVRRFMSMATEDEGDTRYVPGENPAEDALVLAFKILMELPDSAFERDEENYRRYQKVCGRVRKMALLHDGKAYIPKLDPHYCGSASLILPALIMRPSDMGDLRALIGMSDGVDISSRLDGTVEIAFAVSEVYKLREA